MPVTPLAESSSAPARRGMRKRADRGLARLRGPTMLLTAANLGSQVISMICGIIVARWLGAAGRGQLALVQAYDETSTNVLSVGTPEASAYLAKERVATEAKVLGAALKVSMVSLPLTAALGWVVATFAFAGYPTGIQLTAWMAVGLTPLSNTFLSACRMLLIARGQIRSVVPLNLLSLSARLGVLLLLIAFDLFTATSAAITFVVTGWLGNYLGWRALRVRPQGGGPIRPLIAFGLRSMPASFASMANSRLDQLLIAPILSTAALGVYAVAVGVNVLPLAVGVAVAQASYHKVVGTGHDTIARAAEVIRRAALAMAGCAVVSAIGIVLLLEPVYGAEFRDSVAVALILLPGVAASGLFMVVWSTGNAIGDPGLAGKAEVSGLVVTVTGLLLLLPPLGVNGAALVSTCSSIFRLIIGLWLLRRHGLTIGSRRGALRSPGGGASNSMEEST